MLTSDRGHKLPTHGVPVNRKHRGASQRKHAVFLVDALERGVPRGTIEGHDQRHDTVDAFDALFLGRLPVVGREIGLFKSR